MRSRPRFVAAASCLVWTASTNWVLCVGAQKMIANKNAALSLHSIDMKKHQKKGTNQKAK